MRVPIEWLKELVKTKQTPEQLAKIMTLSGLETVVDGAALSVDILPNRSDCWSIRGIAREVAALTKTKMIKRKLKVVSSKSSVEGIKIQVDVKAPDLCPRYMARVIKNVTIKPSPEWLRKRLESVGIRSINNVVDVTNYLLMELGQPLHAFDAGLITDNTLIVRHAQPEEKVQALDGNKYVLQENMLVIADPEKAVAIAGVMGLANSEVRDNTTIIILEAAFFDPISVHKTSQELKLRSESSIRFERGVDWSTVAEALDRGAAMIAELADGNVLAGKIDKKKKDRQPQTITLRPERVNQLLGTTLSLVTMTGILKRLGFGVKGKKISVPLFRSGDVYREIDLTEEIARVYGYDKIESRLPNTSFTGKQSAGEDQWRGYIREIMIGCGFNEVQTDSMVGPKDFESAGLSIDSAVKISNPLLNDQSLMRTMLLPGLLKVAQHNLNRQIENIFVFEIGKVFRSISNDQPKETWTLAAVATGSPFLSPLDKGQADYSYLKAQLENLFRSLEIENVTFSTVESSLLQPGRAAKINNLGLIGELHPAIVRNFDLKESLICFELDLTALYNLIASPKRYKPLPKFPAVSRDIALIVPPGLEHQTIINAIRQVGGSLVETVYLFDQFKDSLAYRIIYRDAEKTLTDTVVNAKHETILTVLESKLKVKIRK